MKKPSKTTLYVVGALVLLFLFSSKEDKKPGKPAIKNPVKIPPKPKPKHDRAPEDDEPEDPVVPDDDPDRDDPTDNYEGEDWRSP